MKNKNKYSKRIVIKVGTNVLTNSENRIVKNNLDRIVKQICELHEQGVIAVLVSSGSAISGKEVMGGTKLNIKDKDIRRQVFASIGQPRLIHHYYNLFNNYGMRCAQVLATKRDFDPGLYRTNVTNCYEGLLNNGVIPIANEDDAVSLSMSMFTDNDELASLVAELIHADMLILLTDIDGLYDGHPDDDDSKLIEYVSIDQEVGQFVQESTKGEGEGRGGMESKIDVAKASAKNDIPTIIANGNTDNIILDIVAGKNVGTLISKGKKRV